MLYLILAKRLKSYGRQILNHWTMRKVLSFLFSGIQSNHFMANRRGKSGSSDRFYFLGFQSYCNGDCNPEIKRHLLLGRKAMTNLDSILKSRDIADKGSSSQSYGFFQESCMYVRVGLWRKLSTEELMLLNCGVGEDAWDSLGVEENPTSPS